MSDKAFKEWWVSQKYSTETGYSKAWCAWQAAADAIAAPLLARIAELEKKLERRTKGNSEQYQKGYAEGKSQARAMSYQRGVADGLEQARNLMEANGMEWAAGKIAEAIRDTSPAVGAKL